MYGYFAQFLEMCEKNLNYQPFGDFFPFLSELSL